MAESFTADALTWTDATLWEQFAALRDAAPDTPALIDAQGRCWSRAELGGMADAAARQLRDAGIGRHDRIMLEGRKRASVFAAALAISAIGGIACPFSPDLSAADRKILEDRLNHVALLDAAVADGRPVEGLDGLRLARRARSAPPDARDAQTALIGFTSGTTGVPKGVMHSPAALNYTVRACAAIAGVEPGDAIIGMVPLGSAPGFTFTAHFGLALGCPLVIVDPWDARRCLETIERHGCAWGIGVPTHLLSMLEVAKRGEWTARRSPLRTLGVGGSAMTPEMVDEAEELLGIKVLRMFGMSECMGHASTRPGDPRETRLHSDGLSFPGTSDEAFDAELQRLPPGRRGQAGVRGPSLFLGYCANLGAESFRLTPDGYFLTGDEIIRGEDGYIKVVGRLKDQIIRGGFNIDPAEVEAALLQHLAIAEVAVVGVPDPLLGERACALCCLRPGLAPPNLAALTQHLETIGVSKKKWPEHVVIVEAMARTSTQKIDKKAMATHAIAALSLG